MSPGLLARELVFRDSNDRLVSDLVATGLTDDDMALAMGWTIQKVRNQIEHLLSANELTHRTQLAVIRASLLKVPTSPDAPIRLRGRPLSDDNFILLPEGLVVADIVDDSDFTEVTRGGEVYTLFRIVRNRCRPPESRRPCDRRCQGDAFERTTQSTRSKPQS